MSRVRLAPEGFFFPHLNTGKPVSLLMERGDFFFSWHAVCERIEGLSEALVVMPSSPQSVEELTAPFYSYLHKLKPQEEVKLQ